MGRTVTLLVILFTIVVGTILYNINTRQVQMVKGLSDNIDMINATHISNSYVYITIRQNLESFSSHRKEFYNISNLKILNIQNASINVVGYIDQYNPLLYNIESVATVNNSICKTIMQYKRMPYSEYALFVNSFPNSYFGTGQVFNGPVYVNGTLGVGTLPGPIFYDNVYCTGYVKYYDGASKKNFKGFKGILFQQYVYQSMPTDRTKIGLEKFQNTSFDISNINQILFNIKQIHLYKGSDLVTTLSTDSLQKYNNILYNKNSNNVIKISGTIQGNITVASKGNISIVNNILYSDIIKIPKSQNYTIQNNSQNLLSIMSDGIIDIDKEANSRTLNTTYDVVVCANLFTTKKVNIQQSYFHWLPSADTGGGRYQKKIRKLVVFGSRTQGSLDNSTYVKNKYGLAQIIQYDSRLKFLIPNGMPVTKSGGRIVQWTQKKFEVVKEK